MTSSCEPQPLPLAAATPAALIAAWPLHRPLIALLSAHDPRQRSRWARWTVIAEPIGTIRVTEDPSPSQWKTRWLGPANEAIERAISEAPAASPVESLEAVSRALNPLPPPPSDDPNTPQFTGGWIGWLGYPLGHSIEPASQSSSPHPPHPPPDDRAWPLLEWHHCPAAYVHDAWTGRWWIVGDPAGRAALPQLPLPPTGPRPFDMGPFVSATGRRGYESAVRRAIDHIEAGDIFQANLAHRLSAPFRGSARSAFLSLAARSNPWYGAYIERPAAAEDDGRRRIIASVSPELFLDSEGAGRRVVTRPIKGTRPAGTDERDLRDSAKDSAELTMIVDLMRNDLGRVCRTGTIAVEELRAIERHGAHAAATGVLHGVATVTGTLHEDAGIGDLLRAAFPPGSVTGAPKIRAMQIIGELEPVPRGPYCGAIGFISDSGRAAFNVAIRTACITGPPVRPKSPCDEIEGGTLDYHAGAGIVAESNPAAEWQETLDKAAAIMSLQRSSSPAPAPAAP